MTTASHIDGPTMSVAAGVAIDPYRRVKLSAGELAYADDVDTDWIGVSSRRAEAGQQTAVWARTKQGTVEIETDGAVTTGSTVYAAADGKVAGSGTVVVGVALGAATDGVIEVLPSWSSAFGTISRSAINGEAGVIVQRPSLLTDVRNADGTVLTDTAAGTNFGVVGGTFGSVTPYLTTIAANQSSISASCRFPLLLPPEFDIDEPFNVVLNASISAAVAVGATVDLSAFYIDGVGGSLSVERVGTDAQAIDDTATDYTFTILNSGFPQGLADVGKVLDCLCTIAVDDTGGADADKFGFLTDIRLEGTVQG